MSFTLFIPPQFVPVGVDGRPLVGAKLWVYRAGTTILAESYTTPNGVPHPNPIIADALGFAAIYLDPAAGYDYRFVLEDENDDQVWAWDHIPATGIGVGGGTSGTPGQDGLTVAEVTIYRRGDAAPTTPTGGSYDFTALVLTPPTDWFAGIPTGTAPLYASATVAAIEGISGVDSDLAWSTPVKVLSDGSSVNIIFQRAASQPATPAPSSGIPLDWYDDVSEAIEAGLLWSSIGTRPHAGSDWIWQLPVQVEGDAGTPGATGPTGPSGPTGPTGAAGTGVEFYYIKPISGTAIKNGTGSLTLEARYVFNGVDSLLSAGDVKLYVGATVVTEANGYATGSDGYTGVFDAGDIGGSVLVQLKVAAGTVRDTITLVDIADGTADTGKNAVFGYVETNGPLAWTRATDQTTWTPSGTTVQLDCTFVQGGVEVARVAHVITRTSGGILTGAPGTHTGGDLNPGRVTPTELGESSQVMTVRFNYSNAGDESAVSETVYTSLSGTSGTTGPTGPSGVSTLSMRLTRRSIQLSAYANGDVVSFADADGYATVWSGVTDVTASATLSAVPVGCTADFNTVAETPVVGEAKGYYRITAASAENGTLTLSAIYDGETITEVIDVAKWLVGYEIVSALPTTNNFVGRVVYLTTTDGVNAPHKLYRYTNTGWTSVVPAVDITGTITSTQIADNAITTPKLLAQSITAAKIYAGTTQSNLIQANNIATGSITAAKIAVTSLSSLSVNAGDIQAGMIRSPDSGGAGNSAAKFDLTNGRIVFNSAPGIAGGYVRVTGGGFGPSSVYLDWYGPKPAGQITDAAIIANLTDVAANYFLKTNGQFKAAAQRIRGEFEVKAWCNFDGLTNGNNAAQVIRDRYNVASVTRNGSQNGEFNITFAEPLANANYAVTVTGADSAAGGAPRLCTVTLLTVNGFRMFTWRHDASSLTKSSGEINTFIVFGSNVVGGSNVTAPSGGTGGGTIGWGNLPSNFVLP
jgi:hypothetical protein